MGLRFVIRDWDPEKTYSGSRIQDRKGTGSWIRIRNTDVLAGPYSEQPISFFCSKNIGEVVLKSLQILEGQIQARYVKEE
jgi:hypothetical protein